MKKLWSILLCAALLCALCACGGQTPPKAPNAGEPAAQDQPASGETEPPQTAETEEDAQKPEELTVVTPSGQADSPAGGEEAAAGTEPSASPSEQAPSTSGQPNASETKPETKPTPVPEAKPETKPAPAPETKPETQPAPETKPETKPAPETKPDAAPETTPETAPEVDRKAVAQGLVGRPVSELYAAIGRPISSDYAPSCLIDGEDGELVYDGFVVYTEKGADYETVYAVF